MTVGGGWGLDLRPSSGEELTAAGGGWGLDLRTGNGEVLGDTVATVGGWAGLLGTDADDFCATDLPKLRLGKGGAEPAFPLPATLVAEPGFPVVTEGGGGGLAVVALTGRGAF